MPAITDNYTRPPLLLDADEVAAVAVGLRTAVAVEGLDWAARWLACLDLDVLAPTQLVDRLRVLDRHRG
jgi:hypothetical protein